MNRKEKEMLARRNAIIDAAEELFFSKGFERVTMEEIAKKAEFTRPTLYAYFNNKVELYVVIFTKISLLRWNMLNGAMAQKDTGYDKLYAFGDAYYEFAIQYPEYLKFMLYWDHYGLPVDKIDPEIMAAFTEPRDKARIDLINAFQLGMSDGTIRNDIEIDYVMPYFCITTRAVLNEVVLGYANKDYYYSFLRLFLRGLKK
ncbi:MAG TPA: TetR/AcrR family transcriptional regulator [Candidatus Cloacimonetes bacterium]|nr:TetR/AcrR family transcriptional regulator [Candidatus Cloacimonadota bacterium]